MYSLLGSVRISYFLTLVLNRWLAVYLIVAKRNASSRYLLFLCCTLVLIDPGTVLLYFDCYTLQESQNAHSIIFLLAILKYCLLVSFRLLNHQWMVEAWRACHLMMIVLVRRLATIYIACLIYLMNSVSAFICVFYSDHSCRPKIVFAYYIVLVTDANIYYH